VVESACTAPAAKASGALAWPVADAPLLVAGEGDEDDDGATGA
jgi:hypothetical protein